MIHRAVKSVTPFEFRSDFTADTMKPVEVDPPVKLTTPELLDMLAEARAEGAATARLEHQTDEISPLARRDECSQRSLGQSGCADRTSGGVCV